MIIVVIYLNFDKKYIYYVVVIFFIKINDFLINNTEIKKKKEKSIPFENMEILEIKIIFIQKKFPQR